MKKQSISTVFLGLFILTTSAFGQIKNEMLSPLDHGVQIPWFVSGYVDHSKNELVLIQEKSSNKACELVHLDGNFKVVKRESGFECGAQQYQIGNGNEYLLQTDWGYDYSGSGGLGFRLSQRKIGTNDWRSKRFTQWPESFDFYKGIVAYTEKEKIIIYHDSLQIDTIIDPNGLGFEPIRMLDSNNFVAINSFSALQLGNIGGILKSRDVKIETNAFVELNSNKHIFVLDDDSLIEYDPKNLKQLNAIGLKSFDTSFCKGLFIEDKHIYAYLKDKLLAFDYQLNLKWSIDNPKFVINDIIEFQNYTIICGNQGGFGFVKTYGI